MPLKPLDPIGPIPKHRRGVPPRHRAVELLAKPAALVDEVNNHPVTRRALARKSIAHVAQAAGHVGALLLLSKARDGHDAFEVRRGQ